MFPTSVVASLWIVAYLENRCPSRSQAPSSQSSCPHLAATRWQGNWGLPKLLSSKETKGQQHIIWEGCITDKKNPSQSLRVMQLTWKDRQQQWSKITGVQRKWHGNRKLMELLPPIHNIVHFAHPLGQFIPWWCLDRMWSVHTQAVAIFTILTHKSCQFNTLTLLTAGTCSLCFPDYMHQNLSLCLTSSKTQDADGSRNKS